MLDVGDAAKQPGHFILVQNYGQLARYAHRRDLGHGLRTTQGDREQEVQGHDPPVSD